MRKRSGLAIVAAAFLALTNRSFAQSPIVLNELMYNPPDSLEMGEYVELYNAGYGAVDLSQWQVTDGIDFTFPPGTVLDEGDYLVVCRDAAHIRSAYGINNAIGDFSGRLSNSGDQLRLVNSVGMIMDELRYDERNPWPASANGVGYSLELRDPSLDNQQASSWSGSLTRLGTPGKRNSVFQDRTEEIVTLIKPGDLWRFFRGWTPPSDPADAWRQLGFDDSSWEEGPSGFGAGDGDDATILSDMQNNYVSVYIRKEFSLDNASLLRNTRLTVDYDDGFVAYLNGGEIVRRGMGEPGTPVFHDTTASISHEAGSPESFDLGTLSGLLRTGTNLLAIECHNESYTNGDLSLIPTLQVDCSPAMLLINEFRCEPEGWVEVCGPSSESVDVGGYFLTDDPADLTRFRIPEPTLTDEAGFAAFDKDYLGFPMPATGGILLLVAPDGKTVLDSFAYGQQQPGMSYGRYPDRSPNWYFLQPPTKGQPNHATFPSDVVINEIMYHTSLPDAHDEYIELYNRGEDAVDLGDWELTGAVRFTFPPGASIPPGGYLVVAESAFALSARYGISGVLGDFSGKLRNYGEKLVLLDALGNPADAVHYADESPWPLEPDGHGPSLELTHPELDNSFGQLWAPSDAETAPEGTPGAPNSTLGMPSPPAIVQTRHAPAVPSSADTVTVTTRVIDDGTVGAVSLFFRRDGEPDFSEVPMAPQGAGSPNDEVYKADLPAEADGTVIQFYIRATDDSSNESLFPDDAPTRTCLYLVDDTLEPSDAPLYRVLLTDANYTELRTRGVTSNVLLDATFICGDRVWYNVGLRYRGYGSRGIGEPNMSYRVRFNEGAPFGQVRKLNLNGQRPASQAVGWDFARRVGIPYSETKLAYLKLNDSFRGIRIQVEAVDEDYLRRVFSEDSSGNLYRGEGHYDRTGKTYGADFIYRGEDPDAYAPYQKQTNVVENDFTDIIHLCDVFTNTPDDQFEQAIGQVINVEEWITYFAVNTSLNNKEGAIYRDTGDDYFIYHYPFDGKWYLIPWDLDTVLDDPTESIFRQTVPMIVRFLSAPSFRLMYYRKLQHLLDYEFSERQMFPAIDSLQGKFGASTLQGFKDVVTGRIADIRGQIVTELTIEPPEFGIEYIRRGDEWHFFRGKEPPSDPPDAWKEPDFDDSLWETGPSGFGFGDNDDATVLSDMQGSYFSVYIRKEFTLSSPDQIGSLQLEVDYDDGFIAYLNGEKVAWGNMPQGDVSYNTPASNNNHEAGTPELFDLTQFIGLLRDGKNVLAIEGHNGTLNSSDVSLIPELRSLAQVVLSRGRWIVRDAELTLTGTAPIVLAETVTVNGLPAEYDLGHGTWSAKISLAPGLNRLVVAALAPGGQTVDTKTIEVVYIPPDRVLGGELTSNVLWTKEPSPYVLAETVVVLPGATLTIEPGTEVLLADAQSLLVEGRLLANGTENDPITFTTYRDGESWGNLAFDQALSSELSYCIVEYSAGVGSYGGLYAGAVALVGSHLDVNGCTFRNFPDESPAADASGIYLLSGASATIRNSRFRCMGAGVHTDHNYVLVENCIFTDIHGSGNDPVDVNGESTPVPVIKNNLFMSSEDDGIDMDRCSPIILGNFIRSSADKGISVGKGSDPRIANNVVVANATGIAVMDGANPLLINNTIVGNAIGLECYEKTSGQGGGMGSVANCILWENDTEILLDALSSPTVSYSLVRGDPVWAGKGNINADPLFLDAGNLDFHLTKLSPCIDAGDQQDAPPDDFDGNARPRGSGFDMGAHESPYWVFVDTDADEMADGWEEHYFSSLAQGAEDDFDQDGMNDLAEYDAGADPTSSDTDADGLPDGWEWANGLSPVASTGDDGPNGDRDRDGMSNLAEYIAGTSPNDPQSVFEIASVVANGDSVGLTWPAHKTKEYRVLVSTDLLFWTEEATIPPGGERQAEWFDNNSNGKPRQFYKLEVLP
jgi:parallel beta-helix repeat protein